jgi:predicted dehydrogenase
MPRKYRVAVIGRKGKHTHGLDSFWKALDNVEVVALAGDADQDIAAAEAKRIGARTGYTDYRAMLEKERPQIVSISDRDVDFHQEAALACARAAASIILEKPMARSLAEADEIVAACERYHVKLALAHQTSYSPTVRRIQELIAAGRLGELVELRGRGLEDQRGAPHDLISHGTHIFDLMRLFAGPARWCFGRVWVKGKPATKADVREERLENVGPVAGDNILADYGFDKGVGGSFGSLTDVAAQRSRFGLVLRGTKGVVQMTTGSLPPAWFLDDPSWFPGRGKKPWQPISGNGLDRPETLKDGGLALGDVWIAQDLMAAIEQDRQPLCGVYDARLALEMTLAVYESHRLRRPVPVPLENRRHPLKLL